MRCKVCGQEAESAFHICARPSITSEQLDRLQRQALAKEVFDVAFEMFDSFKQGDVGKDLVYLLGAILDHTDPEAFVDWRKDLLPESELREFMVARFPKEHAVWHYIRL